MSTPLTTGIRATEFLNKYIDGRAQYLARARRHLHANPEPSGEELETTRYVFEQLRDAGIDAQVLPSGRGLIVDLGNPDAMRRIAIRADIDALRLQDLKEAEYSSDVPHVMHACGHDGHTACVLGVTLALHAAFAAGVLSRDGAVRILFQPAEESATGAQEMIDAGALESVDTIIAAHLDPSREVGRVGVRFGAFTAACDDIEFVITGSGGHAARPHESRDPIFAASQLINALYSFVPRATDSNDAVVLTIGLIIAGDSANVIPENAVLRGTLRTLLDTTRDVTRVLIERLAHGVAEISDTEIDARFGEGPPSVVNDAHAVHFLREAATEVLGKDKIDVIERPSMGGEDFAFYLKHVPGAMFRLGCASDESNSHPLHSPYFDIDERSLPIGAKVLSVAAARWLEEQRD
jgi:amidohydrolase